MKSIRIFIKYLRKFLAGFASIVPFVRVNSNSYPFNQPDRAISGDWEAVGEDLYLAINKNSRIKNERK
ncbi:MAG: hypothetical protein K0R25_601 [Rickettsiaceae bacterium]|jgi:hypothetical protein|nr:hypothetical protein [Rickettsiaceae bacterium]